MNLSFFHDTKLKYDEKTKMYYTSGGLNKAYLSKYLEYFDNVTLITREEKLNEEDRSKVGVCSAENIFFHPIRAFNFKDFLFGRYNKIIKKEIEESDFSIIRLPSFIGIIAMHYVIKLQKNHMVEMVACPFDALWNYGNIKGKLVAPIMYIITKHYVKKAKNVIYVSNEFLQSRYPNKNNNIGCSDVNLLYIDDKILEKRLNKIKNKNENDIYKLGLIGSLNVKYKGHKTAIKAISKLKNKNIELHFLGTGNKSKWVKLAQKYNVEKQVFFDGALPSGQPVYDWMDELDLFLIPSFTEGMPRALIEVFSRACPALGTKVGGIVELLPDEFTIKKNDYNQLVSLINKVIYNKEILINMAERNYKKSLEFKAERLHDKKKKFINDIISNIKEEVKYEKSTTCSK